MKPTSPTSRDIAEIAGVSQATVSRALRNSPLVREETRERVHQIARDLNYFVNRNAAGLRTQQSNTIALLLFDETEYASADINPFFLTMLGNITRCAAKLEFDVLVSLQQLSDDWHIEFQASHKADGLILLGYGDYVDYRPKLEALADASTQFIIWGPKVRNQPGRSFGCDNESGGRKATEHLLNLGRRRIAFIGDISRASPELAARHDGYRKALTAAGLESDHALLVETASAEELGYKAAEELLRRGQSFDAVFAVTDALAIGAMHALKDAGLAVPEQVGIVGFDDLPIAAHVSPPLSTVRQDPRLAAEGLVNTLVGMIRGEPVESTLMEPQLIVRQSCGAT